MLVLPAIVSRTSQRRPHLLPEIIRASISRYRRPFPRFIMMWSSVYLTIFLLQEATSLPSLPKQNYTIRGWITETPEVLMQVWKPIFGDYLTKVVGTQYDPRVTFHFSPIDYTEATRIETLIHQNEAA